MKKSEEILEYVAVALIENDFTVQAKPKNSHPGDWVMNVDFGMIGTILLLEDKHNFTESDYAVNIFNMEKYDLTPQEWSQMEETGGLPDLLTIIKENRESQWQEIGQEDYTLEVDKRYQKLLQGNSFWFRAPVWNYDEMNKVITKKFIY